MACPDCCPELGPVGPRKGEHHYAVRFGDWHFEVYVLGSVGPVLIPTVYEIEVGVGPGGTSKVWEVVNEPHVTRCECGLGAESRIVYEFYGVRSYGVVRTRSG